MGRLNRQPFGVLLLRQRGTNPYFLPFSSGYQVSDLYALCCSSHTFAQFADFLLDLRLFSLVSAMFLRCFRRFVLYFHFLIEISLFFRMFLSCYSCTVSRPLVLGGLEVNLKVRQLLTLIPLSLAVVDH